MDDFVQREGFFYEKFTDVPFSGKVTGRDQGSIKNGKQEGLWISYYDDGLLFEKGDFKNGDREGLWIDYYDNGQLNKKGNYKNGVKGD